METTATAASGRTTRKRKQEEAPPAPPAPTASDPGEVDLDSLLVTEEQPDEEPDHWREGRDAFAAGGKWISGWEAARPRETDDGPARPPTIESVLAEGRAAHAAGASRLASPYTAAGLRDAWEEGWDEGSRTLPPEAGAGPEPGLRTAARAVAADMAGAATAVAEGIRVWLNDPEAVADSLDEVTPAELRTMTDEQVELLLLGVRGALRISRQRERRAEEALRDAGPGFPPPEGRVRDLFPACRVKSLEVEMVRVDLTTAERLERADELARANDALNAYLEESREVKAELAARERQLEAEVGRLTRIVRDAKEDRRVPTVVLVAFDSGLLHVVRQDTGEVLRSRALTGEERQGSLWKDGEG